MDIRGAEQERAPDALGGKRRFGVGSVGHQTAYRLRDPDRDRRLTGDRSAELERPVDRTPGGDDLIHQSKLRAALSADPFARKDHLARHARRNRSRESNRAPPRRNQTEVELTKAESSLFPGDDEVARQCYLQAPGQAVAFDGSDQRPLGDLDRPQDVVAATGVGIAALDVDSVEGRDVTAGAERPLGPGQHAGAYTRGIAEPPQRRLECVDLLRVECVELVGSVEADQREAILGIDLYAPILNQRIGRHEIWWVAHSDNRPRRYGRRQLALTPACDGTDAISLGAVARTRGFVLSAFGPPDVLRLEERELPSPAAHEVLVTVEAAGVNFGDTMIRRGEYLRDQPLSMAPGCEVIGRVQAVGSSGDVAPGERVAGWVEAGGAYAEHVLVPAHRVYPVPDDLPAAAIASVFFQGTTAYYGVHRYGRLKSGETLLVHGGSGGVGGLAIQLGRIAGARVIATASSEDKRNLCLEYGADVALDSRDAEGLTARLRAATDGRGCDVIVDGVGGPLFMPSLRGMAVRGRYVIAGSASQQPAMLDARHLLPRTQTICGFILAHITEEDRAEPTRTLHELCGLIRDGKLMPRYETIPLADAPDAHRRIEDRTLVGKVVLEP